MIRSGSGSWQSMSTLYSIYVGKLRRLTGRSDLNPLSSVQVGTLVYEELGWEVVRGVKHSKKSGKPSADEESLEILMWSSRCNSNLGRAILRTIIDCRKFHKCTEFLTLPTYPDRRHRCEFNLAGAETGRTTAGETSDYYLYYDKGKIKLGNMGHSFQTIGKHGFAVDGETYGEKTSEVYLFLSPGYSFVECDLSLPKHAWIWSGPKDFDILRIFDTPTGIHRLTGSWVFNCDPNEIKKNDLVDGVDRYHVSKTVRHAGERNMSPMRLMMMIAKEMRFWGSIKKFHDNQPNIRHVFHREIREQIQRGRILVAPNGRRRDFFGRINEETVNQGISQLPQAIVTDYMKAALPKVMMECRDFMRPLSEAHDGFLSEVKQGREEEYGRSFKKNVEVGIDFRSCSLTRDFVFTSTDGV